MFSSKLASVCGSLISSGSVQLVYTEGVSICSIFITENTLCPRFSFFVCVFASFNFILAIGNLGGGHCKNSLAFQVRLTSTSLKGVLFNNVCVSFTSLVFTECLWYAWHCAFYLLIPWTFREKKMPHSFAVCLDYHLVEFAPSSPWWWIITVVVFIDPRKTRDVNLVSAASIFPILWRNAFVFIWTISHQFFFSGEKTVVFWIYCRTEIPILLLWETFLISAHLM